MRIPALTLLAVCLAAAAAVGSARVSNADLRQQVIDHERAFAATMAERDFDGFVHYLAGEAIFMEGDATRRGKTAVAQAWRHYYEGVRPPFSWEPDQVEVVESGTLAYSSGPIRNVMGERIGTYNSVWRLDAPGRWTVVFDRGCDCRQTPTRSPEITPPAQPEVATGGK